MAFDTLKKNLKKIFSRKRVDADFLDELEDDLVGGDVGPELSGKILALVKEEVRTSPSKDPETLRSTVRDFISSRLKSWDPFANLPAESVWLFFGVNGVGKTSTIAKVATLASGKGIPKESLLLVAADTYRAAAVDQLEEHGRRVGVDVITNRSSDDPSASVYDGLVEAKRRGARLTLVDTAGRMPNRKNLLAELGKMDKIIASKASGADYRRFLVIDATTGMNGLAQAELFHGTVKLDGLIVTKYDSTAKAGIILTASERMGIPACFICQGESYADIVPFDPVRYMGDFFE